MKALGLALMLINHLVAPFISPWLAIFTGESTRHLLIAAFLDPKRYQFEGRWKHAQKLSIAITATIVAVALIQTQHVTPVLVQMPIAWWLLIWLRPLIMNRPARWACVGILLWSVALAVFLQNPAMQRGFQDSI